MRPSLAEEIIEIDLARKALDVSTNSVAELVALAPANLPPDARLSRGMGDYVLQIDIVADTVLNLAYLQSILPPVPLTLVDHFFIIPSARVVPQEDVDAFEIDRIRTMNTLYRCGGVALTFSWATSVGAPDLNLFAQVIVRERTHVLALGPKAQISRTI